MHTFPEERSTDHKVLADAGTSEAALARQAQQSKPAREEPPIERTNLPPRKKKNEALVLKHYRLRATDVRQIEAVVIQRGSDMGDTVRKQYERGVNVDTALSAPGEDGLYGLYQGERLAELLRVDLDGLISFALRHGVVPTILQEYRRMIQSLNETIQSGHSQMAAFPAGIGATSFSSNQMNLTNQQPEESQLAAVTEIAGEADGVLGMFFGEADSSPEMADADHFPSQ